jgi:hypothetical protein
VVELADVAFKIRSKNAGPFWVTIDIFCGDRSAFEQIRNALTVARVAELFGQTDAAVRCFEIPDLNVIKYSLPRPCVQGSRFDRDMHGAQWAVLVAELDINVQRSASSSTARITRDAREHPR